MKQDKKIHNRIFSSELKRLMGESASGVTQARLAEHLRVSQPTIYRYLQGQEPKASELLKLAQFFDVLPDQLLNGGAERGSYTKKYLEDNPHPPGQPFTGPAVPLMPHPLYKELGSLSAELMDIRKDLEQKLAGVATAKLRLDTLQTKLGSTLQRAAQL